MKSAFSLTRLSQRFAKHNVRYLILQLLTLTFVSFSLLVSGAVVHSISTSVDSFAAEISEGTDIVIISPTEGAIGAQQLATLSQMEPLKTLVPVWWSDASIDEQRTLMIVSTQLGEELPNNDVEEIHADAQLVLGPAVPGEQERDRSVAVNGKTVDVSAAAVQRLSDKSASISRINGGNFIIPQQQVLEEGQIIAAPKVIFVALQDGEQTSTAIDTVESALPANTTVVTTAEYKDFLAGNTKLVVLVANMFGLAMLITGVCIISVISALALDSRRYEYSLLRLIGTSKRKLISWNIVESVVLAIPCIALSILFTMFVAPSLIGSLPDALFGELPIRPAKEANIAVVLTLSLVAFLLVVCARLLVLRNFMRRVDQGIVYLRNVTAKRTSAVRSYVLLAVALAFCLLAFFQSNAPNTYGLLALAVLLATPAIVVAFAAGLKRIFTGIGGRRGAAGYIASSMLRGAVPLVFVSALALSIPAAAYSSAGNLVARGNELVSSLQNPSYYVQTAPADALPLKPLLTSEDLAEVEAMAGVDKVVPGVLTNLSVDGGQFTIQGIAAHTSMPAAINAGTEAVDRLLHTPNGVIVNRKAAEYLDVTIGDHLNLPLAGFAQAEVVAIDDYISVNDGQIVANAEDLCTNQIECNYSYFEIHATGSDAADHLSDFVEQKNAAGGQEFWLNTAHDEYLALSQSIAATSYLTFMLSLNLFFSCFVAIYILYRSSLNKVLPTLSRLQRIGYPSAGISATAMFLVVFASVLAALVASALYVLFGRSLSSLLAGDLAISGVDASVNVVSVLGFGAGSLLLLVLWGGLAGKRSLKRIHT